MIRVLSVVWIVGIVFFGSGLTAWAEAKSEEEKIGNWSIRSEVDPIFDTENVFATLIELRWQELESRMDDVATRLNELKERDLPNVVDANSPLSSEIMEVGAEIIALENERDSMDFDTIKTLHFRCQAGELAAFIVWERRSLPLSAISYSPEVIFRFDALEPRFETWSRSARSTDQETTFARNALEFIRTAAKHERLTVRTKGREKQMTAIFDLKGVEEVVERISQAQCFREHIR